MKYKPVSTECSKRCGRERRPGGRLCRVCHAAEQKAYRAARVYVKWSELKPSEQGA